jgi:hypothetical protein
MEKASGVSLKSKWLELSQQEAGKLAHSFLKIEETLSKLPFSSTGSLYFRKDITPSLQTSLYQKDHAGEDDNSVLDLLPTTCFATAEELD